MAKRNAPEAYVEPHERESGPWEEHELDSAGHALERAAMIQGNPKFGAAIVKHHETKAKRVGSLAKSMRRHLKSGMVSEKALERAAAKKARG